MARTSATLVPAALDGERVDRVVALITGLTRSEVAELVERGAVRVNGRPVRARSRRVTAGEPLDVELPDRPGPPGLTPDPTVDVPVVYADEHVIVVDKPAALVVHPGAGQQGGTLAHGLVARFPDLVALAGPGQEDRPGIVHRLDKGTSGLLAVARTAAAKASLSAQLAGRTMERRYTTLVWGQVAAASGLIDAPIRRATADPTRMAVRAGGRDARTRYRVERRFSAPAEATLLECRLETGRTHQIRVHLSAIGHPVAGDSRYGRGVSWPKEVRLQAGRLFLHAHHLEFEHPATGARVAFSAPLPADLTDYLGSWG